MKRIAIIAVMLSAMMTANATSVLYFTRSQAERAVSYLNRQSELMIYCGYDYEIEIGADGLNQYDMAIDFSEIKTICDEWLQKHFDHKTLFSTFQTKAMDFWAEMGWEYTIFPMEDKNTTAENMAYYLAYLFFGKLQLVCPSLVYVTMRVRETNGSEAEYTYRRITDEI